MLLGYHVTYHMTTDAYSKYEARIALLKLISGSQRSAHVHRKCVGQKMRTTLNACLHGFKDKARIQLVAAECQRREKAGESFGIKP